MINIIREIAMCLELSEEDLFWLAVLIVALFLWAIVQCLVRTEAEWISVTTKDEFGNEITIHSRIKK